MTFTFGNQGKSFSTAAGLYSEGVQLLTVTAGDNPTQEAAIVTVPNTTGTVTVESGNGFGVTIVVETMLYNSVNGEFFLTVSSVDGSSVDGSFNGTVADILGNEIEVTNGQFSSDYATIP